MVVPKTGGSNNRPQHTVILFIGTPLNFGKNSYIPRVPKAGRNFQVLQCLRRLVQVLGLGKSQPRTLANAFRGGRASAEGGTQGSSLHLLYGHLAVCIFHVRRVEEQQGS